MEITDSSPDTSTAGSAMDTKDDSAVAMLGRTPGMLGERWPLSGMGTKLIS